MSPEEISRLMEQAVQDWDVIRENPTLFLSNHKGKIGELYRSEVRISRVNASLQYLASAFKNLVGIFIATPDLAWSEPKTSEPTDPVTHAVITMAGDKYRFDAERIQSGLQSHGKRCALLLIGTNQGDSLRPRFLNRIQGAGSYGRRCIGLYKRASDSGRRLLLASHTLNALRSESLIHVLLQDQQRVHNLKAVISIVPFNQLSRSITGTCDKLGITTYALRTQTVNHSPSHLAINTRYLFYRTEREQKVYENLRPLLNSELIPGGIYNLPPVADNEQFPKETRKEYVLILGTTPANNESFELWQTQTRKIITFAAEFGQDIIYKSHNLAVEWDKQILTPEFPQLTHHTVITDNRSLIDNANLILSFPSTLLYYILQIRKPFILLSNSIHSNHEFSDLSCVEVDVEENICTLKEQDVFQASAEAATVFNENFKPIQNENLLVSELIDAE